MMLTRRYRHSPSPLGSAPRNPLRGLVLAMLCLVAIFNYVDRQIMGILLQPIKETFRASDTTMGFLTGLMFATCYAVSSLPLAHLSDRKSRNKVLAGCLITWSALTSLGGLAQAFWQLAVTRIGVAVAESGAVPASHAIISDLYGYGSRARAIGVLSAAQSIGVGLGLALGGWLAHAFSWRVAFAFVGLPGFVLSIPLLFLKEPARGHADPVVFELHDAGFVEGVRHLWSIASYRYLVLTIGVTSFPGYALLGWAPTFLIRVHGLSMERTGAILGLLISAALLIGSLLGGILADKWGARDVRRYLWIAAAGPVLATPFLIGFTICSDPVLLFGCLFVGQVLHTTHIAPCYTLGQTLVPADRRATASVFMGLASVFMGAGLGPFVLGSLTDVLATEHGKDAIRWSLGLTMSTTALTAVPALLAAITVKTDYARVSATPTAETA